MSPLLIKLFSRGIWGVDFEFHPRRGVEGNLNDEVCMTAKNFMSGEKIRLWRDELKKLSEAPFPVDEKALIVAYFSTAELNCFLSLGWKLPVNVLDLYVEFRRETNGLQLKHGKGLLGALLHFGIAGGIESDDKHEMRDLILSTGPWTDEQKAEILDYCESDVDSLEKLFLEMTNEN